MDFIFDLWSFDDEKTNVEPILDRVEDGTMPFHETWSENELQVLRLWIAVRYPS